MELHAARKARSLATRPKVAATGSQLTGVDVINVSVAAVVGVWHKKKINYLQMP